MQLILKNISVNLLKSHLTVVKIKLLSVFFWLKGDFWLTYVFKKFKHLICRTYLKNKSILIFQNRL